MQEQKIGPVWHVALLSAVAAAAALGAAPAHAGSDASGTWTVGVLGGEGLNHNFANLLPEAVKGNLDFQPAHLAGLVVQRELALPGGWADWAGRHGMQTRTSVEVDLLKGGGLVDNTELDILWRPAVTPWPELPLQVELSWGIGVSQSFGQPWSDYTDPDKPRGYRTLLHMSPQMAFRWHDLPDWALALRIQHRSGLYGVFAPRRVGSNHMALVLTHDF